jgi:uncharacterized protein (TIGR04255 family)
MVFVDAAQAVAAPGDLFPPSPRVIYEKAPLSQVICQLRFPPLLKIESEPPADFQERIRHRFPLLERTQLQIPDLPPELAQMLGAAIPQSKSEFSFRTEDGASTLNLGPEQIALTTTKYTRWERFLDDLTPALQALLELYRPSFFQRVGLRYINTIVRSALEIPDERWSALLQSHILGELTIPAVEAQVTELKRNIRVDLPNELGCAMFLQHGFAKKADNSEIVYRLDFDFSRSAKTEVADARDTLNRFNSMVGRAFRWCITESLHEHLRPVPMELDNAG